jgi:hypothetical protein
MSGAGGIKKCRQPFKFTRGIFNLAPSNYTHNIAY